MDSKYKHLTATSTGDEKMHLYTCRLGMRWLWYVWLVKIESWVMLVDHDVDCCMVARRFIGSLVYSLEDNTGDGVFFRVYANYRFNRGVIIIVVSQWHFVLVNPLKYHTYFRPNTFLTEPTNWVRRICCCAVDTLISCTFLASFDAWTIDLME